MKYIIILLSFLSLSFGEDGSSVRVFSNDEVKKWRVELSDASLQKAYNNEELSDFPLDRVQPFYEKVINEVKAKLLSTKLNEKGFKLNAQKDKELLIYIVEVTRKYSRQFDPGNAHFRAFSKLYKSAKKDISLAIEQSSLTAYDKKIVRANIR